MTNSSGARRAVHKLLHPRGDLASPAWRSPPTPYLLRRAGAVNRGAVWGRVQLDGRRLLLGHFEPGKGASNSKGKAAPLLPPSALPRDRHAGPTGSLGLGGCFRGGAPRAVPSAPRSWWRSRGTPTLTRPGLGAQGTERLPRRRSSAARDSFPLSLSQRVSSGSSGSAERAPEPCSNHNPRKYRHRRRRASSRSAKRSLGGTGGGGGVGKREASPPAPHWGCCLFHTPTRLRPNCLANSQWEQASEADDAEIRHGGAARCPGGGVRHRFHSALC